MTRETGGGSSKESGLRARAGVPLRAHARRVLQMESGLREVLRLHHEVANSVQGISLQLSAVPASAHTPPIRELEQLVRRTNLELDACRDRLRETLRPEGERFAWRPPLEELASRRRLELDVADDAPEHVTLVEGREGLETIVDELADNAGEAKLRVEARRVEEGEGLVLCFVDEGPGFALPEEEARLPFTTTRPGAEGLGLFLVDCVVRASGGRMHILPGARRGTLVRVLLRSADGSADALRPFDP